MFLYHRHHRRVVSLFLYNTTITITTGQHLNLCDDEDRKQKTRGKILFFKFTKFEKFENHFDFTPDVIIPNEETDSVCLFVSLDRVLFMTDTSKSAPTHRSITASFIDSSGVVNDTIKMFESSVVGLVKQLRATYKGYDIQRIESKAGKQSEPMVIHDQTHYQCALDLNHSIRVQLVRTAHGSLLNHWIHSEDHERVKQTLQYPWTDVRAIDPTKSQSSIHLMAMKHKELCDRRPVSPRSSEWFDMILTLLRKDATLRTFTVGSDTCTVACKNEHVKAVFQLTECEKCKRSNRKQKIVDFCVILCLVLFMVGACVLDRVKDRIHDVPTKPVVHTCTIINPGNCWSMNSDVLKNGKFTGTTAEACGEWVRLAHTQCENSIDNRLEYEFDYGGHQLFPQESETFSWARQFAGWKLSPNQQQMLEIYITESGVEEDDIDRVADVVKRHFGIVVSPKRSYTPGASTTAIHIKSGSGGITCGGIGGDIGGCRVGASNDQFKKLGDALESYYKALDSYAKAQNQHTSK